MHLGDRTGRLGVGQILALPGRADRPRDVVEDGLVDVDATDVVVTAGFAAHLETTVGLSQHRRVEGAAAEIVDTDMIAWGEAVLRRVVSRGCHRLRKEPDVGEAGEPSGLFHQVLAVTGPGGGAGQHHMARRLRFTLGDFTDDKSDHVGDEVGYLHRRVGESYRHVIAEPALELPCHPGRIGYGTPFRGLTDQHYSVVTQEQYGRYRPRAFAEVDDLSPPVPPDRGRGERGPDVDAEGIGHEAAAKASIVGSASERGAQRRTPPGYTVIVRWSS